MRKALQETEYRSSFSSPSFRPSFFATLSAIFRSCIFSRPDPPANFATKFGMRKLWWAILISYRIISALWAQVVAAMPHHINIHNIRHRASTSILTNISRSRYNTPAVWTKLNGARSRQVDFIAGERSLRRMAHACVVRAACGGRDGLPLGSATHFHSVATATQPVHRLQIRPLEVATPTATPPFRPRRPCSCLTVTSSPPDSALTR